MATPNPLVIPEGFAELTLKFGLAGDPDPMTVSYGVAGVTDGPSLLSAVSTHITLFGVHLLDTLGSAYTFIGASGRTAPDGSNLVVDQADGESGGGGPGTLPQNCALIVKKLTLLGGRQHKGRFYWAGMLAEGDVDPAGNILTATVTALQTAFTAWETAIGATDFVMVLLHSKLIRDPANPPPAMITNPDTTPDIIENLVVESVIATQRRRLR